MDKYTVLALVVAQAAALSYACATHDQLAARRFRELDPRVVKSDLDRSRNRRWHTAGAATRLLMAVGIAAGAGLALQSWVAFAAALGVAGFLVVLLFDILFNLKFGMDWDYLGTTAWLDEWLAGTFAHLMVNTGRLAAGLELAGAALSMGAWLLLI